MAARRAAANAKRLSPHRQTSDTGRGRIPLIRHDAVLRAVTIPPAHFIFQGIFVSHRLAPALLAALFLVVSSFSGARAEPAAPAVNNAATLSPDEARRALETL